MLEFRQDLLVIDAWREKVTKDVVEILMEETFLPYCTIQPHFPKPTPH